MFLNRSAQSQHSQFPPSLQENSNTKLPRGAFWQYLVLALIAGCIFPLALAPYHLLPIALVSPAILYAVLKHASPTQALWIGQAYGTGLWCVGAFWLFTSINTYSDTPTALALVMVLLVGLIMGLFHALFGYLLRRFFSYSPLSFSTLWVIQEWLKTWLFTGFPWLFTGYAYTQTMLDAYAPVLGVIAVSFIGIFMAASLVTLLQKRWAWAMFSAIFVLVGAGISNISWTQKLADSPLKVTLIQGNIPQDLKWLTDYRIKTLEIYNQLSTPYWGESDVVVWPESAIPMFQTEAWPFINVTAMLAKQTNTTWLTGIPYQDTESYDPAIHDYEPFYNSIIALGDQGEGIYHKQRLVPFGEYIPLQGMLDWVLPSLKRNHDILSFSEGSAYQKPLQIKGHPLGAAICYEVAYPGTTRNNAKNSHFLITVSNDAWFGTSAGPLQHLQMVQMRARETGRWFIRATNTGVTAFIDHRGAIVSTAPRFKQTTLTDSLPAYTGSTPYMRFGDWPVLIFSALCLMLSMIARWR